MTNSSHYYIFVRIGEGPLLPHGLTFLNSLAAPLISDPVYLTWLQRCVMQAFLTKTVIKSKIKVI